MILVFWCFSLVKMQSHWTTLVFLLESWFCSISLFYFTSWFGLSHLLLAPGSRAPASVSVDPVPVSSDPVPVLSNSVLVLSDPVLVSSDPVPVFSDPLPVSWTLSQSRLILFQSHLPDSLNQEMGVQLFSLQVQTLKISAGLEIFYWSASDHPLVQTKPFRMSLRDSLTGTDLIWFRDFRSVFCFRSRVPTVNKDGTATRFLAACLRYITSYYL